MKNYSFKKMISDIRSDYLKYSKPQKDLIRSAINFLTVMMEPGFTASSLYRVSHYLYLHRLGFPALVLYRLNKVLTNTELSFSAEIGKGLRIPHSLGIVVGSTATIGNNVEILNGVTLGAIDVRGPGKRHPDIGDNVVIGTGAKILGNIHIGSNSKIGANSVVLDPIPPDSIAVGIPARVVKK